MSHSIETMAYTAEVPWHGLGFKVNGKQSVKQMLKAAKLDWNVEKRNMFLHNDGGTVTEVPDFFALMRDKDNKFLDVVGKQYTPVQNEQAFEFFNDFVKAGKATMETAGSLKGGKIVWGLAKMGHNFTLPGNDKVEGYLLCVCPHEQGKSNIFKVTTIRVVCNNTLSLALRSAGAEHRRAHRGEFNASSIETAKQALGIAHDQLSEFEKTAKQLQRKKVSKETTIKTLLPIFSAGDKYEDFIKRPTPRLTHILNALEKAPGAQPGTAWGVLNAVTYYADHIASRSADKRLTNAWLGRTANQKEQVLKALLEL